MAKRKMRSDEIERFGGIRRPEQQTDKLAHLEQEASEWFDDKM